MGYADPTQKALLEVSVLMSSFPAVSSSLSN